MVARLLGPAGLLCVFALLTGCAQGEMIRLNMTQEQVVAILGEPDRRAILDGKVMQDIEDLDPATDVSKYRQVFIYDADNVQVWLMNGRVTGMTQGGVSVLKGN